MYELTKNQYNDDGIYRAIDAGIITIVTAVNTRGKSLK
jgi:hypothetical protein